MSQSDSATNSVDSQLSRSPSARTARSQEADANQQEKQRNRRMTVYGDSHTLHFQSPDVNAVSIKRASLPTPKQSSTSPAMSSSFSRSSSGRSLSSGSEVHISPGQCSPYTTDFSPEPGLKHRETGTAGLPSLSDGSTGIITANVAIDGIIRHLVGCVKEFKAPSELDFSATTKERPLFLAGTKKNRPFMNQFCKLTELRNELAAIPTHGNRNLEDKYQKTDMAIGRALERMKNHQLKLYDEFTTAFDCVRSALDEYVASFEYPSELDFVANWERTGMYLLNNDKNKPFINQLLILHGLRTWLAVIPTHGDPERKYKCQAVSVAVEKAIKDMQKHQLKLWNKNAKARL